MNRKTIVLLSVAGVAVAALFAVARAHDQLGRVPVGTATPIPCCCDEYREPVSFLFTHRQLKEADLLPGSDVILELGPVGGDRGVVITDVVAPEVAMWVEMYEQSAAGSEIRARIRIGLNSPPAVAFNSGFFFRSESTIRLRVSYGGTTNDDPALMLMGYRY